MTSLVLLIAMLITGRAATRAFRCQRTRQNPCRRSVRSGWADTVLRISGHENSGSAATKQLIDTLA